MAERYLEGGRIINTFGIRGEVKIEPWCDSAEFLRRFQTLYIDNQPRKVRSARVHKGMLIALLEGVEDVNGAMLLKNKVVFFDRGDARLPKNSFFLADVIGCTVVDETGETVGTVTEVLTLPAQNVYVVQGEREHSIPAVPEFVLDTDLERRVIRVHLIEGM